MIRACTILALVVAAWPALAAIVDVRIDLSDQEMTVALNGAPTHRWPVSTARAGKVTPVGLYRVQAMKRMHYSTLYDNAPMPHSLFFSGNFAIHGTDQTERLGTPASAGCVRLSPGHAETLYNLVLRHGRANTLIEIVE
ncbi:MAG: L,D-transpeptidase [Roseovarius sp.]|nr:L,D-transpeptidase [Roseovarius sp.]